MKKPTQREHSSAVNSERWRLGITVASVVETDAYFRLDEANFDAISEQLVAQAWGLA